MFQQFKPQIVFLAAGKVGGIIENSTYPVEFLSDNILMGINVINASYKYNVQKLLYFGSSCIYPSTFEIPIKQEFLLTTGVQKTNEAYALAKISVLKLCEYYHTQYNKNFITCMPNNIYGDYRQIDKDPSKAHVVYALFNKILDAKNKNIDKVIMRGSGDTLRQFLHSQDLAKASIFLMQNYDQVQTINIGVGYDVTIKQLTHMICNIVEYTGQVVFTNEFIGMKRKLLDSNKIFKLGWQPKIKLTQGLSSMYNKYMEYKNVCNS